MMQPAAIDPAVMRRAWLVLVVVSLASFQSAMSLSIIFVVYADLKESFPNASEAELSWIINSFTIVGAATLVIGGVLGERWGRRRTLMAGIAVFTLASAGAALAPDTGVLIVARALQGIGTSLSLPTGAAIVIDAFPVSRRGTGVGAWSANGAVAAAMGPSVGALLVHVGDWRWAFWLNVPFGVIALVFIRKVIQEHRSPQT
ncbi:MAG: MFS transporter, partial [Acidimicrobiia bacterium]|nr:MFS transporter [Acidimicrobiia bacterium]